MSGRKQGSSRQTEPVTKRRRVRTRESQSGSSSNGETSQQRQPIEQRQPIQQQQQQTPVSPPTVTSLPVVNQTSSRPTAVTIPSRRPMDSGDQIAPTSPRASRRVAMASLHVSEQMGQPMDPIIHHQVSTLPKESFKLCNTDFICPICFEVLKEPFITRCGHTYCYDCITTSIKSYGRCPMCNEALNEDDLIANAQFNEVIYKFRKQQEAESLHKRELPTKSKEEVLELLKNFNRNDKESVFTNLRHMMKTDEQETIVKQLKCHKALLSTDQVVIWSTSLIEAIPFLRNHDDKYLEVQAIPLEISQVIKKAQNPSTSQKKITERENVMSFLTSLKQRKHDDINLLEKQIEVITKDLETLMKDQLMAEKTMLGGELCNSSVSSSLSSDELPGPSGLQSTHTTSTNVQEVIEQCPSLTSATQGEVSATQKQTIESFFDEIAENYIQARVPVMSGPQGSLEEWGRSLNGLTELKKFRELGTLMYGDPAQGPSIVSSIDFDKDEEFFAVGGVTRQLKVYEYNSVVMRPVSVHYPVQDLTCASKISSVSYNYYLKNLIASCDYDGTVIISDVSVGKHLRQWREHEKRCWSVHFNHSDPKIVASGSDDFKIKIWVFNVPHSVGIVNAEANVCSVRFHPASRYYLAYGCADHKVHYYDLRDLRQPLCVLEGHKKAVSYCQFLNNRELVSLSTDSEMKLWDVNTGRCLKTYHGHKNDKNFVGLTVKGSHIVCGSENNSLYCYYKDVSKHIMTYRFNVPRSLLPGTVEPPDNPDAQFVSAVCWKPRSSVLLAANSQGYIKVLEAV